MFLRTPKGFGVLVYRSRHPWHKDTWAPGALLAARLACREGEGAREGRGKPVVIPIRDANPTTRTAWITLALIAANILVFLLWQPTLKSNSDTRSFFFYYCHALVPWEITHQTNLAEGGAAA